MCCLLASRSDTSNMEQLVIRIYSGRYLVSRGNVNYCNAFQSDIVLQHAPNLVRSLRLGYGRVFDRTNQMTRRLTTTAEDDAGSCIFKWGSAKSLLNHLVLAEYSRASVDQHW